MKRTYVVQRDSLYGNVQAVTEQTTTVSRMKSKDDFKSLIQKATNELKAIGKI